MLVINKAKNWGDIVTVLSFEWWVRSAVRTLAQPFFCVTKRRLSFVLVTIIRLNFSMHSDFSLIVSFHKKPIPYVLVMYSVLTSLLT